MGEHTNIGWCHHTFNPWEGCEKISPGCTNCYAATQNDWLRRGENWGPGSSRRFFGEEHWRKPLRWNYAAQQAGEQRRVFCASIADVFEVRGHPLLDSDLGLERRRLWDLIAATPWLIWMLLTKRPENVRAMLSLAPSGPWANIWLGVTAENDEYARRRIPLLRGLPASKRFVSYEPALGPIDWTPHLTGAGHPDLVIFGDESGRKRRPAEIEWARSTRDACAASGVAFFFKQWCGADADGLAGARDRQRKIHLPVLDGRAHREMPVSS